MRILGIVLLLGALISGSALVVLLESEPESAPARPQPSPTPPSASPAEPTPTVAVPRLRERRRYVFPVRGGASYGAAHHDYPAADMFADCGTPVVTPASGVVLQVTRRDSWDWGDDAPALRGGLSWSVGGDDGVRYYGSHLRAISDGVRRGEWIPAGTRIGTVGQTGNAAGTGCHLHFGISPLCERPDGWWVRRGIIPPYAFLRAWESGRDRSPANAIRRWQRTHRCPPGP
ncbi:MAG: peptidoglycan DD-metalloendopeptidase family protein [Propionibacteriales bacterium]|nr:peptidoglycan DD-metalloendopeptidase family protein [Propionibacteriales bacterium]